MEAERKQEDEEEFEIEVVDDRPEEDRRPPKREEKPKADAKDDDDDDDDVVEKSNDDDDDPEDKKYSEGVQKRIKKLRFEFHEERRAKEESKRLEAEAIAYARRMDAEAKELRKQLEAGEGVLLREASGKMDSEIRQAERAFRDAYESGDAEEVTKTQSALARLQAQKVRLEAYNRPRPKAQPQTTQQPPAQQAKRTPAPPDEMAQQWASKNPWFNRDRKMTGFAYGVHEDLVLNKRIDPRSKEYYQEIDREMRKAFPDHFDQGGSENADDPGTVVAAPSRKAAKRPRTVRLTATQVALCKKLGITQQQYAARLLKESGEQNG